MADGGVNENVVEYRIFPHIPEDSSPQEIEQYLTEQIEIYFAHLSFSLVGYIWQNEPFHLRPVVNDNANLRTDTSPPHLVGSTNYGDNVDDEWYIVYLLRSLTEEFPGLVAQMNDNDGEFLLIEAANSLPKWVNPETAENRVYLYEGTLHIIPYPLTPAHIALLPTSEPSLYEAVTCIRANPALTMAQAAVQQDIQNRLNGYPEKAEASIHHAHCYIPASLAAVLEHSPNLIAPIVQAFYQRDPIDLKSCVTFRHFPPGTRVMRRMMLTRCLYAQLAQQQFTPDKRSGYTLPPARDTKHKAHSLGAKLAHGAEILCSKCGSVEDCDDPMKVATSDPRWHRYLATLNAKGYFKNEIEGSQLYKKLLEDAKHHFVATLGVQSNTSVTIPGVEILQTLKRVHYDVEEMRREERDLLPDDDDDWLNISPDELDAMMSNASGQMNFESNGNELNNMADGMKAFVNKVSSHEGAELPQSDEIQFDPNSFMQTMHRVFEFNDSDGASSSDMSEYGSEDECDEYYTKPNTTRPAHTRDDFLGMKEYMDIMDRELAKTNIGKSFEKDKQTSPQPTAPPRKKKQARTSGVNTSTTSQTTPPKPSTAPRACLDSDDMGDIDDLDDDFEPVNIDLNMVTNLMDSYNAQAGMAGPTSNILGSMGVSIPRDSQDDHHC